MKKLRFTCVRRGFLLSRAIRELPYGDTCVSSKALINRNMSAVIAAVSRHHKIQCRIFTQAYRYCNLNPEAQPNRYIL